MIVRRKRSSMLAKRVVEEHPHLGLAEQLEDMREICHQTDAGDGSDEIQDS